MPSLRCTAITMPPLAVPSSLVSTTPVTSTTSVNTRACSRPFWPVVASRTSSVSSTGPCFSTTRLTLPSSSIRPTLFCSRPAVSISTVSTPVSMPRLTASNATAGRVAALRPADHLGADPAGPGGELVGGGGPERVGRAEHARVWPSATSTRAILPQVVVLPDAVDADHQQHRRACRRAASACSDAVQRPGRARRPAPRRAARAARRRSGCRAPGPARAAARRSPGSASTPTSARDQALLDLVPGVVVELVAGQQREQALAEHVLRAATAGPAAAPAGRRSAPASRSAGASTTGGCRRPRPAAAVSTTGGAVGGGSAATGGAVAAVDARRGARRRRRRSRRHDAARPRRRPARTSRTRAMTTYSMPKS